MPLKKECLPGALVEVKGLSDKEKGEVIALVGEHEEKELFEFHHKDLLADSQSRNIF